MPRKGTPLHATVKATSRRTGGDLRDVFPPNELPADKARDIFMGRPAKLSPAVREITEAKKIREAIQAIRPLSLPHLSMWLTNQLVDYVVRDDGIWLRDYNVRVATFAPNSQAIREVLGILLDEAYRFGKSLTDDQAEALAKLPKPRARRAAKR